jgi:hypothetical protein
MLAGERFDKINNIRDGGRIAVCLIVTCAVACVAPATIYRPDGPPLEAAIEESDATTLRLRDEAGTGYALGQMQVSRIDHPGDPSFFAGILFVALGVLILRPALRDDIAPEQAGIGRLLGGTLVFTGVVSTAFGGTAWLRSRRAAEPFNDARPRKPPRPFR